MSFFLSVIMKFFPTRIKFELLDYLSSHPYVVGKVCEKIEEKKVKYYGLSADEALIKLLKDFKFETVLDVGSGEGRHADIFLEHGKHVTTLDYGESIYFKKCTDTKNVVICDYYNYQPDNQFDCIWASHVLEHQPNPHAFLKKIFCDLKEGGVAAISVPPLKHDIVGGHLNLYNAGLLLYQMVVAGFDCSNASIHTYGYNVSIIVVKSGEVDTTSLMFDSGDIYNLSKYFPKQIRNKIGDGDSFDGRLLNINW